jgi:hypothetical protein
MKCFCNFLLFGLCYVQKDEDDSEKDDRIFLNAAVFWSKRQGVLKKRDGVLSVLQIP